LEQAPGRRVECSAVLCRQNRGAYAENFFSITISSIVPSETPFHFLPSDAERLAPQLRDFGYVVVEELIAMVDQGTRKIEIVFQIRLMLRAA
jgi:hypothetical protein